MSGITLVTNIAREALFAQQKGVDVTAHNIANVNTPGYSRQKLILEASDVTPLLRLKLGYGVNADSVQQLTDQFVTRSLFNRTSTLSFYETQSITLDYLQGIFNEATENGLNKVMADFWNSWQDLVNNPGGMPERTALLQNASNLCQKFQITRNSLFQSQQEMNTNLAGAIAEINKLTEQIAQTNDRIVESEAVGTTANDLRDQRNNLVQELSQYFDLTYLETEAGAYTVLTKSGIALVDGDQCWTLSQEGDNIYWNNIETDVSSRLTGGKVGAWLDLRDDILPQYMANLDELAGTIIHEVNALHYIDGYTLDGDGHKYFFNHLNTVGEVSNGTWTGTSVATSGGDYTGRLNKSYTFTVPADGTVGGAADVTVNWAESATGRTGTITIPAGYTPGTAIHVDGINDVVESSGWTGTAQASSSGNYTGTNDQYTFTVQSINGAGSGTGTVGTDEIVVYWETLDGSRSGTLTLADAVPGPAYVAGTAVGVEKGLQIAFASGTLGVGEQFTVETEEGLDVSFSAGTIEQDDTFSISCADYAGASQNITLSADVDGLPRNIASSTSSTASETGNNTNALAIQALQDRALEIRKWSYQERGGTQISQDQSQTLDDYYNILVGDIGVLANQAAQNQNFHQAMINQLNEQRDSVSGVSLDEEMINMMKYQYAFQAASKLITTADEMFQTILEMRA
jgi:flagellar hook-associated protein 1